MYTCEDRHYDRAIIIDKLLKQKVKVKFIITKITERGKIWIKEDLKKGVEIRYYPVENLRMSVKDELEVIVTILNPKNPKDRIYLYAESEGMAKAMGFYFDYIWQKAKPIEQFIK